MKLVTTMGLIAALGLCACGGGEEPPGTALESNTLSFDTGPFTVPPGDVFECFYTSTFTDRELSVSRASGYQGPGGHHILVMYANEPREVGHHPCSDEEMVNLQQVVGVGGEGGDDDAILELTDDMAIRVPAGKQLVLQAHYINTTGAEYGVNDHVTLHLMEPSEVSDYVNYVVTLDEIFEVPAQAAYTHVTHCDIERDLKTVLSLGHMHEAGKHYTLEVIDGDGQVLQTIRDEAWAESYASHPPIDPYPKDDPLILTKGMRLRQTCTWENDTPDPLLFPREMCLAFFYYYPDAGDYVVNCYEP